MVRSRWLSPWARAQPKHPLPRGHKYEALSEPLKEAVLPSLDSEGEVSNLLGPNTALNLWSRTTLQRGNCWKTAQNLEIDAGANRSTGWTGQEDFTVKNLEQNSKLSSWELLLVSVPFYTRNMKMMQLKSEKQYKKYIPGHEHRTLWSSYEEHIKFCSYCTEKCLHYKNKLVKSLWGK